MLARDAANLGQLKWGFAMSGGGAKGAYTAGVMYGLHEAGYLGKNLENVKVLIGVSTGALVAAGVAHGDFKKLKQVYTEVKTKDVIRATHPLAQKISLGVQLAVSAVFGPQYLFDTSPMRNLVRDNVGKEGFWRMIQDKNKYDVSFVSVDLPTGKPTAIGNQTKGATPKLLEDAVMASTNQPVLMDLVKIDNHLHCDGGLRDFLPMNQLLRSPFASQLDVFVTIPLDTGKGPEETTNPESIFDVLVRTVDLLSYEVGHSDQLCTQLIDALQTLRRHADDAVWKKARAKFPEQVQKLLDKLHAPGQPYQFIDIRPSAMPISDGLKFVPSELKAAFELGKKEGLAEVEAWVGGVGRGFLDSKFPSAEE